MSNTVLPCPHCHVQHPVPALPPAGTHLRCNACGNAFVTGAAPVHDPFAQSPLGGGPMHDPFAQSPLGGSYDPFAQMPGAGSPLAGAPLKQQQAPSSDVDPMVWKVALGIGAAGVAIVFLLILVNAMSRKGETPSSTAVASVPAPTSPVPSALPTNTGSPAPTTTGSPQPTTPGSPVSTAPTTPTPTIPGSSTASPFAAPAAPTGTPAQNQIRQLKAVETKAQFHYGWKAGEKYRYGFEAKADGNAESAGGKIGVVEYELTDLSKLGGGEKGSDKTRIMHPAPHSWCIATAC
jgi:hypothetical protein